MGRVLTDDHIVGGDIRMQSGSTIFFGDKNTDGTYKMVRSGNDRVEQRRESGSWVEKDATTPDGL